MLLDVPEAERICYVFNDRWPFGHPIRAKEGFAFRQIVFSADGKTFATEIYRQRNRWADIEDALSCFSVADGRLFGTVAIDEPGYLRRSRIFTVRRSYYVLPTTVELPSTPLQV